MTQISKLICCLLSPSEVAGLFFFFLSAALLGETISQQRQEELVHFVKHDCGSCHGITLKGGLGPALTKDALDGKPHGLLFNAIKHGRENTAMPPWAELLTQEEIEWLVVRLQKGNIDNKGQIHEQS